MSSCAHHITHTCLALPKCENKQYYSTDTGVVALDMTYCTHIPGTRYRHAGRLSASDFCEEAKQLSVLYIISIKTTTFCKES